MNRMKDKIQLKGIMLMIPTFRQCKTLLVVVIGVFLLAGCSILQPVKTPEMNKYVISPSTPKPVTARPISATLLVSQVEANSGFRSSKMIYSQKPYQMEYFSENTWMQPPATMLTPLLVNAITDTGRFQAVVSPPFVGHTDYRLDTKLLYLYQDFVQQPVSIKMALSADLVDNNNQLVKSKRFTEVEPVLQNNPYGGVLATNKAVAKLQSQIVAMVLANTTAANR